MAKLQIQPSEPYRLLLDGKVIASADGYNFTMIRKTVQQETNRLLRQGVNGLFQCLDAKGKTVFQVTVKV